jgi:diguanylate cyclase (GGDEF)-like protein/PAS domain S-box-containing protein
MAKSTIRLLLAEDEPADQELELRELKRAGLRIEPRIAVRSEDFTQGLREFSPDVVVSDFSMPGFDGMEALRLTRELAPDVPFIFVSGTLGEDYAIRALKSGATDYVLKSNLIRLPAAVERALVGAEERRARRRAEAGLRRAQGMAKLAHVITGPGGGFESWSESLPRLIGSDDAGLPRTTRAWLELLHPDDRETLRETSIALGRGGGRAEVEYRLRRSDGQWIDIRQVIEPLEASDAPQAGRWFGTLQDITEQKQAENAVRRLNRVYAMLSGISSLVVRAGNLGALFQEACEIAVREGRFPMAWIGLVSEAGQRVDVVASAGDVSGDYLAKMPLELKPGSAGMAAIAVRTGVAVVANDIESDQRFVVRREALERGFRSIAVLPLVVEQKVVGVMALYAEQTRFFDEAEMRLLNELAGDVSLGVDHIQKAKRLDYVSSYDALTGLANRTLLMDRLDRALASSDPGKLLALAVMDIERFKTINDSLGRAAGDALLAGMAARLRELAGDAARVARTGPDQFAVIIPGVRSVERVARAIDEGFRRVEGAPFELAGTLLRAAVRCGIAVFPGDGRDADTVFRNAEAALKKAKQRSDKYLFYTQEMTERVAERLSMENRLRQAIEREEFVLHYQPKVVLADRSISGVEALIRWQSTEGLVPPLKFIGILEETGLIGEVGAWALRQAARDHRAWLAAGLAAPRIAVNVSAIQLRNASFVPLVEECLRNGGSQAGVDIEITESLLMDDIEGTIRKLEALRILGLEIAIDDFGTGYSSLAYLARLPVQALKIDRSFVSSMDKDSSARMIVSTIISLAHSLRLKVVAEGVETESQAATLHLLRCDAMQGYLVSKPVPVEALTALLREK